MIGFNIELLYARIKAPEHCPECNTQACLIYKGILDENSKRTRLPVGCYNWLTIEEMKVWATIRFVYD